ncbi:2-succinyl-5-enolpyruvyl-6-hydroxy-3-cyclohexene-1-carboxylic-acid synthase [Ferrimonas aestuarii]|uniref:2-succinyl-5-enolpyruvyl-6-hydroxy-3-cyclohexene-1-carboxylate synthase n=1 Tax=Ferrimonas aestuarii TaxID=2569539 RepID=A0A4U1BJM0_9GAMM|nr:2-succinyl-5-enolpyruvyl-6-hydroxy-3-cyclohexene-1-carboxylic-acid synthase [Ferrimonas aestuarii]TKB51741.1 2-succinyl-5-enolpyruvyl-6-hydroxy-3-cyclohexene-1-carboxylic-acid synthase [Ferrimonas aestuarii]
MNQHSIADLNLLWSKLILEELHRLGVKHICLAPGSRSTPLTLAAAEHGELTRHTHFDERGLAFLAMGLAKSSQSPVALVTTSGTALANLYPAIVEAYLTKVPLILLTGDRPPELIDCGANQAINQPNIFGSYAKAFNLPTPSLEIPPTALLSQLDHQLAGLEQPLHINCMFREPLYPQPERTNFGTYLKPLASWLSHKHPWNRIQTQCQSLVPNTEQIEDFANGKGVIVAGTLAPEHQSEQLLTLADKLGWPVIADCQSQLRQHPQVLNHSDQLLHNPKWQQQLAEADRILMVGARLLSKRLMNFIDNHCWAQFWQLLPFQQNLDPGHNSKQLWYGSVTPWLALEWPQGRPWHQSLSAANTKLETQLRQRFDGSKQTELSAIRIISQLAPKQSNLFIGNSLPIRLFDSIGTPRHDAPMIYTNRGASGIDGLVATAVGIARGNQQPTTLVIGDLSLLHDLNSLALVRDSEHPLVIVAINNDGGNIFNLLPVPNEQLRTDYYRLGHGLSFKGAAEQFELTYLNPKTLDELKQQLTQAWQTLGPTVIELTVPPQESAELLLELAQYCRDDLSL